MEILKPFLWVAAIVASKINLENDFLSLLSPVYWTEFQLIAKNYLFFLEQVIQWSRSGDNDK